MGKTRTRVLCGHGARTKNFWLARVPFGCGTAKEKILSHFLTTFLEGLYIVAMRDNVEGRGACAETGAAVLA